MSKYISEAVPFEIWGNRQVLTRLRVAEMPWLLDFIKQFPACFEFDWLRDAWLFYPEGDAPSCP
jgi:hypothetical protein